jgi:1,4-dihydroxy-2-naphthoyl-CoA hydrolase
MAHPIWLIDNLSAEMLNEAQGENLVSLLQIRITEVGPDFLKGEMPVTSRVHQPFGILHGGASIVLAETLGSMAANLVVDSQTHYCVGLEVNGNHVRSISTGTVYGVARPLHIGRSTQVWAIEITDELGKPVCFSRLTMAVLTR